MSGLMGGNIGWNPSNFQDMFGGGELGDWGNQAQQTLANQGGTMGFSPAPMSAQQPAANPLGQAAASLRKQSGMPSGNQQGGASGGFRGMPDPPSLSQGGLGSMGPGIARIDTGNAMPPQQGGGELRGVHDPPDLVPGMTQFRVPSGNQQGGASGGFRGMPDPPSLSQGGLGNMGPGIARIAQQMGNTGNAMPPQQGGNQQKLIAALLTELMRGGLMGGYPEGM